MVRKTRKRKAATPERVYELKITLVGSKPPIWRRVAVGSDISLGELHDVIQIVMGWTNSHLHQFMAPSHQPKPTQEEIRDLGESGQWGELVMRSRRYRCLSDPAFELEDAEDEFAVRLEEVAPEVKSKFGYEYDFGDSWEHRIEVVKIGPPAEGVKYPVCLKGKLACPPDDCGGIWGYYEMLEALQDPKHESHEELSEWIGEDFDPLRFDLEGINAALAELR